MAKLRETQIGQKINGFCWAVHCSYYLLCLNSLFKRKFPAGKREDDQPASNRVAKPNQLQNHTMQLPEEKC